MTLQLRIEQRGGPSKAAGNETAEVVADGDTANLRADRDLAVQTLEFETQYYTWINAPRRPLCFEKEVDGSEGILRCCLPDWVARWPWNQWPDARGTGGRISVESMARCSWNRWPDGRGIRILGKPLPVTHQPQRFTKRIPDFHFALPQNGKMKRD